MIVPPYEDDSEIILATARATMVSSCHMVDPAGETAWSAVVSASGMARTARQIHWSEPIRRFEGESCSLLAERDNQQGQMAEVQFLIKR